MSEHLELGLADADSRWIGIRRHQAALVIVGLALAGDFIVRPRSTAVEGVLGALALLGAIPTHDSMTGAQLARVAVGFLLRSHWTSMSVSVSSQGVVMDGGDRSPLHGYELVHLGRLDLSGRDHELAESLANFADSLASGERTRHFSIHLLVGLSGTRTLLVTTADVAPPPGWRENDALAREAAVALEGGEVEWLLERWSYVRRSDGVHHVLRVRDFGVASRGRAVLDHVQAVPALVDVVLHVDVIDRVRAQRLASRAVHRVGSDDAMSQAAGFRRTATSARSIDRLHQRETLVAEGRALLRLAVYLVVRAPDLDQLRVKSGEVERRVREAGLRCERGNGRQLDWYRQHLPGGPN